MTRINNSSRNQAIHTITYTIGTDLQNPKASDTTFTQLHQQHLRSATHRKQHYFGRGKNNTYLSNKIRKELSTKIRKELSTKLNKFTCARENSIQKLKKLFTYSSTAKDNQFIKPQHQDTENYPKNRIKVFNHISQL